MVRVLHLIDDPGLGGVNRGLEGHLRHLRGDFQHERRLVRSVGGMPKNIDADVIIVHFTVSWAKLPYLVALRRCCRGKLVLVEHSYTGAFESKCVPNAKRFRTMLRFAYGLFDRVIAVSFGQAAWLREAELVAAERLRPIQQALDLSDLQGLPLPSRSGPLRLGAYGRLHTQKGFDRLIEAMRLVRPDVATLHIAGFGPEDEALQELASDLPHVRVEPTVVVPALFLAAIDAVIIPSRWEAFGLVALEARAAGRPLIVANLDGLPEQLAPGTGLVIDSDGLPAIADAIDRLAGADLDAMAIASRETARGSFETHLALWETFLEELSVDADGYEAA